MYAASHPLSFTAKEIFQLRFSSSWFHTHTLALILESLPFLLIVLAKLKAMISCSHTFLRLNISLSTQWNMPYAHYKAFAALKLLLESILLKKLNLKTAPYPQVSGWFTGLNLINPSPLQPIHSPSSYRPYIHPPPTGQPHICNFLQLTLTHSWKNLPAQYLVLPNKGLILQMRHWDIPNGWLIGNKFDSVHIWRQTYLIYTFWNTVFYSANHLELLRWRAVYKS